MTQLRPEPTARRVLLKLSGESLCEPGGHGVQPESLDRLCGEILDAASTDVQMAVVVGGGNIIRGGELATRGLLAQATADQMGMLGTVINGLAIRERLGQLGLDARCMTAMEIPAVAEPLIRLRAIRHLEKNRIVILAGGTGNPFFTTDSAAALRAAELNCDQILKATKVDGVYSSDPKSDPKATRYDSLTFDEALAKKLRVMDQTALALCREHDLPVMVFDFQPSGNIRRAVAGDQIGTTIRAA